MASDLITIDYFSDVLCVWAYGGQVRLDELQTTFGERIRVRQRFMTLFGDTATRIGEGWSDKGGFEGFGAHMQEVCERWPHTRLNPVAWSECRPASCLPAHLFLSAARLGLGLDADGAVDAAAARRFDRLVSGVRCAFFEDGRDIARRDVLDSLLEDAGLAPRQVAAFIDNGEAHAALHRDAELAKAHGVLGSPTYLFNEGRQLLYGNVGYRIIEANVRELLSAPAIEGAPSWC